MYEDVDSFVEVTTVASVHCKTLVVAALSPLCAFCFEGMHPFTLRSHPFFILYLFLALNPELYTTDVTPDIVCLPEDIKTPAAYVDGLRMYVQATGSFHYI